MGIFSSAYLVLKNDIYNQIPKAGCLACGECCVTPHVTLIEFCYMMDFLVWESGSVNRNDIKGSTLSSRLSGIF